MKKLTLTLLSLLVVGAIYFTSCKKTNEGLVKEGGQTALSSSSPLYVGFRDASGNAVLDINDSIIESFFSTQVMALGADSITFEPISIVDTPSISGYLPTLSIYFLIYYIDGNGDQITNGISLAYPLYYDSVENKYYAYDLDYLPSEINGGKLGCQSKNCVGCRDIKNWYGGHRGCTDCLPNPGDTREYGCGAVKTGGSDIDVDLGGININLGK